MKINFLKSQCSEEPRTDTMFGLCDDQNGSRAYSDVSTKNKWIATVINNNNKEIVFTAIDNCFTIYKVGTKDKESTCDGMLSSSEKLFLVELKVQQVGGWLSEAILQLENTIKLLNNNIDLSHYKIKKAFACNKKHPNFTIIENERQKAFFKKTNGFRIMPQTEIEI